MAKVYIVFIIGSRASDELATELLTEGGLEVVSFETRLPHYLIGALRYQRPHGRVRRRLWRVLGRSEKRRAELIENRISGKFQAVHTRILRLLCPLVVITGLFTGISRAQTGSSPSSVYGVVQDSSGGVIAGADVELRQRNVTLQSARSDSAGTFRFSVVSAGTYAIVVHEKGFQTATTTVKLGRRPPAPLHIVLSVAAVRQAITVSSATAQVRPETSENVSGVTVSGQTMGNLPVFDQDYIGTLSRFLSGDVLGTAGATLIVNGVESNDLDVSPSAIKEIKINHDPYDAEYPRPGWGRIEVTTKPGSPRYHGEFNFIFRDARLNARDPFALTRPPEQRRIFEGMLSGPVRHSKRTSFLISADHDVENLQSVIVAQGPSGAILQNYPSPAHNLLLYGRIDHQLNENNNHSVSFSYQHRTADDQGIGGLTLPEAGYNTEFNEEKIHYDQSTVFKATLVNEFHLLIGQYHAPTTSLSHAPKVVVLGAFTSGGAQADQLRTEHHLALTEMVSYSRNKHLIKAGINVPDWSRRGLDNDQNFGGTFYFSTLTGYTAHQPFSFTEVQGNGHLVFVEKMLGGFVQDDYHLKPNFMLSAGLRWDWENYFSDPDSFAPRLAFAYAPGKNQKTIIRGGTGIFHDRTGPWPMSNLQFFNGQRLRSYVLTNPEYPDPLALGEPLSALPPNIVQLDPRFRTPYMGMYSLGVERQLAKATTLSFTYIGGRDIHRFRSRDVNAPLQPLYTTRPDPSLGIVQQYEAAGRGAFDTFHLKFQGRATRYFTGMAEYRLGWSHDDTSGIYSFPANNNDLTGEWGRSDWDRRHRFELLGTFNQGKLFNLGVGLSLYSGAPFDITTGFDPYRDGMALARPPGVARNTGQGPGYSDLDLRWSHDFSIEKGKKGNSPVVTVGLEAFNALNEVNYGDYVGNLSSPFFGHAVSASPPRRIQTSLRLKF